MACCAAGDSFPLAQHKRMRRVTLIGVFLALMASVSGWGTEPAAVLRLDSAIAHFQPDGAPAVSQTITLPYAWDYSRRGTQGTAQFEITFPLDLPNPSSHFGLYLPKLGNAYEIRLNGVFLQRRGDLGHAGGSDFSQQPRHIAIPPNLLVGSNVLQVRIRTDAGRRGGLSQLYIGPEAKTHRMYMRAYHGRVTGTVAIAAFSFFVGVVALVLWGSQTDVSAPVKRRRDLLYLFAGLAELCWSVRVGDALIENPPLPWPLWGVVPVVAMGVWIYCMSQFCIHAANWSNKRTAVLFGRWIGALAWLSGPFAYLALTYKQPLALTVWYASELVSFLVFGAFFVVQSLRHAKWPGRWIALAILLNVAVGARDFYVFRIAPSYPDNSWMRYSSIIFGLALGYFVVTRFRAASAQSRDLLANLAARVAERELALQESYVRVEALAREQARSLERASILRDMHDGVGSHISSAIRQVQSGLAHPDQILQTLRDSLDQLKLTIDSMHLAAGDVVALLANLRYRLGPRLENSGIKLHWDVDLLPPLERLDVQAMRSLQFIVLEVFSNTLQHSKADRLSITVKSQGDGLRLSITDNGKGFDVEEPWHKGLVGLRERAHAIGAQLTIFSLPGQTTVTLDIER